MNDERIALYAGTRNICHDMVVSAKSLLYHNGADRIVFLTEDETFPEYLPQCINVMDVSNQTFFPQNGPNYHSRWTYMVMMRTALTKLFPDRDRILSLDHDTIVRKPIDALWELDLSDCYYAAVEEKQITNRQHPYYNFGVVMHNLAKLREDHTDDTIILSVNSVAFPYCEQDAVNSVCRKHILKLPAKYNAMHFNTPQVPENDIVICHHAARKKPLNMFQDYQQYDAMTWEQVLTHKRGENI